MREPADRYLGLKALVLGWGISGRAAAKLLASKKAHVTALDEKMADLPSCLANPSITLTNHISAEQISSFDLVVASPGFAPSHALYAAAIDQGVELIGEMELACRFLNHRLLGITGTNGKTTVTSLVEHVLKQSGVPAQAIGNIGKALCEEVLNRDEAFKETWVVEISSFHLETLRQKVFDAAIILNVTPDHLDRHGNLEEYARTKLNLAHCLKAEGVFYAEESCFRQYQHLFNRLSPRLYGYDPTSFLYAKNGTLFKQNKAQLKLPHAYAKDGASHDLENLMAAYALCECVGITPDQFLKALSSFKKPAHRIEFVRDINGVSYYDDSKGTNVDAVMRAVQSLKGEIILIAGGVDKGASYKPWLQSFGNKVKCICTIGQAASKIQRELSPMIDVIPCDGLEKATLIATRYAKPGFNVLLSPGCSSYDMFRDYQHRGEVFQKIVNHLAESLK